MHVPLPICVVGSLLLVLCAADVSLAAHHTVRRGDSLWAIARRHGTTAEELRQLNALPEGKPIVPGQRLELPEMHAGAPVAVSTAGHEGARSGPVTPAPRDPLGSKPSARSQVQKSKAERGGINPCNSPDPGFGPYEPWDRAPSLGQMIAPRRGGVAKDGSFDVMFHFHGHEAVRKEWVQALDGPVLVGIDLGVGSAAYAVPFQSPTTFARLVHSVEQEMAKRSGNPRAHVRRVGLSSWSAGYGAVAQILSQPTGRQLVDTVVVLDGMHTGYLDGGGLDRAQLAPFVDFARRAAAGDKLMFISHSSIVPPGYASSTETARFLVRALGGEPRRAAPRRGDPWGLDLNSRFDRGSLHVRGYDGNDKMDHCAHLGLYRDVLAVHVAPRWRKAAAASGRRRATPPAKVRLGVEPAARAAAP